MKVLTADTLIQRSESQVATVLEGEVVLVNLDEGAYYHLNRVGSAVWDLLESPRTVKSLCNSLIECYAVEPEQCEREVVALLGQLLEAGLIESGADH